MSGKSGKNKRPIICSPLPKQLYFKFPYFMGTFICLFSLFFTVFGWGFIQSHTLPIIISHRINSYKNFFRLLKRLNGAVTPYFQKCTALLLRILPVRFRRVLVRMGAVYGTARFMRDLCLNTNLADEQCTRMYIVHHGRQTTRKPTVLPPPPQVVARCVTRQSGAPM